MNSRLPRAVACIFILSALENLHPFCFGQVASNSAGASSTFFAPLEQWKSAIISGEAAALKALYSTSPAARIDTPGGQINGDADVAFWTGLKARSMKVDIVQSDSPQPGLKQVVVQAEVHSAASSGNRTVFISEGQLWQQQGERWRLVVAKRTDPARLQQPTSTKKDLYPSGVDAHAEIKEALQHGSKEHRRVLVVFGANWCYDCHVLDLAFHRSDIEPVLKRNYEVVHVDVGEGNKNQDLMTQYQVPMARGIPGLAVLDSDGKLLFSQKNGEFEKARALAPEDLLQFLNKWKPQAR
ncbi:MAG TPA: thioredoxin family protein [Terriglobales bacterium]|nr:thioredoxin family protein [Terriglobales bacterium]